VLVRRHYTKHTRELFALLGEALVSSRGDTLELTPKVLAALARADEAAAAAATTGDAAATHHSFGGQAAPSDGRAAPTPEQAAAALKATNGNKNEAARRLGITRYAFYRLLRRWTPPR
jgi:transcriptional regulator of acetoin/glycerol metabolism